jgi:hypothetical protein
MKSNEIRAMPLDEKKITHAYLMASLPDIISF